MKMIVIEKNKIKKSQPYTFLESDVNEILLDKEDNKFKLRKRSAR